MVRTAGRSRPSEPRKGFQDGRRLNIYLRAAGLTTHILVHLLQMEDLLAIANISAPSHTVMVSFRYALFGSTVAFRLALGFSFGFAVFVSILLSSCRPCSALFFHFTFLSVAVLSRRASFLWVGGGVCEVSR